MLFSFFSLVLGFALEVSPLRRSNCRAPAVLGQVLDGSARRAVPGLCWSWVAPIVTCIFAFPLFFCFCFDPVHVHRVVLACRGGWVHSRVLARYITISARSGNAVCGAAKTQLRADLWRRLLPWNLPLHRAIQDVLCHGLPKPVRFGVKAAGRGILCSVTASLRAKGFSYCLCSIRQHSCSLLFSHCEEQVTPALR